MQSKIEIRELPGNEWELIEVITDVGCDIGTEIFLCKTEEYAVACSIRNGLANSNVVALISA